MIKRSQRLLVSFYTTTDAMAMEDICRREGMGGRLIPVPSFITADCGLAWCASPEDKNALINLMQRHAISHQALHHCMI